MAMVAEKYKFYLSFENSFCTDYITEKLWKVLNYDIVPIVMGGGNYTKYAPAKSYINYEAILWKAKTILGTIISISQKLIGVDIDIKWRHTLWQHLVVSIYLPKNVMLEG